MKSRLALLGSVVGWAGAFVCVGVGTTKLFGMYYLFGIENMSLFTVGIGMIAVGCLAKLEAAAH